MGQPINLTGQRINEWTVIEELGGGKVRVQCSCGTIKDIYKKALISGKSKSCGCLRENKKIKIGDKFGDWEVIDILPNRYALCKCSCGNTKEVFQGTLKNGMSKSCGCRGRYNTNNKFGYWTVIGKSTSSDKVLCRCICGNEKEVYIQLLKNGKSMSCGCKSTEIAKQTLIDTYGEICTTKIYESRDTWQVKVLSSEEEFKKFLNKEFDYKPTTYELCNKLALQRAQMLCIIHKFNAENCVDLDSHTSGVEREIRNFVESAYNGNIIYNDRKILNGLELDIYIPEKKLAIEINGVYWHSEIYKDKNYHLNKTLKCRELGIKLIHVFDYEWDIKKELIKSVINNSLGNNTRLYARDLKAIEISTDESDRFLNKNHLQGKCTSDIRVALVDNNNEIKMLTTFGRPRFSNSYEYEMLRMCNRLGFNVVGGASKCLRYFTNKYKPRSIVSYADSAKFIGDTYNKLGFKFVSRTPIGYKWANGREVISRYKTQKQELINKGLGIESETEADIMHRLGYFRVYDCGNEKYELIMEEDSLNGNT